MTCLVKSPNQQMRVGKPRAGLMGGILTFAEQEEQFFGLSFDVS